MAQIFRLHPQNPQPRLVGQAVSILRAGGVMAYPTDSSYALACTIGDRAAQERIRRIRGLAESHFLTLVCRDLSEIGLYAKVGNTAFRLIRSHTPGPYTFILKASRDVPRRLQDPKRRSVGLRVPGHPVAQALLEALGEPLLSATLVLPEDEQPMSDGEDIAERLNRRIDLVIDSGPCGIEPTSVVDLSDDAPEILRRGLGDVSTFER